MKKKISQGQIKAFLEQCSFFLVTWASCSYNREVRHFNSAEAGCRLGSAGALGGGWWGLPRVLLPLIFICPAHGAGSPPNLEHQEQREEQRWPRLFLSLSLRVSWQEESWLSRLSERIRGQSYLECKQKTAVRSHPEPLPPLSSLMLSEWVACLWLLLRKQHV